MRKTGLATSFIFTLCATVATYVSQFGSVQSPRSAHFLRLHENMPHGTVKRLKSSEQTFPGDAERLRMYARSWTDFRGYDEFLSNAHEEMCHVIRNTREDAPHTLFNTVQFLGREHLEKCVSKYPYCADALSFFETGINVDRLLVLFGDVTENLTHLPFITKARKASSGEGILWPLNVGRHFAPMALVAENDFPWKDKQERLVWRGKDTGCAGHRRVEKVKNLFNSTDARVDVAFEPQLLDEANSGFARHHLSRREMLRNKYLLALDGNDVASALKWMLYSNSVVFMPKSRFETWALESMLKPYVHYVPVASDLSDTSEQLDWAKAHDAACQNISRRATEFISNFIGYATNSGMSRDQRIKRAIVKAYNDAMGQIMAGFSPESCDALGEGAAQVC